MTINFDKVPRYIQRELDDGAPVVKRGASGQRVRRIQEWLNYHQCKTQIDGAYGPATAACVSAFQQKKRLSMSGRVEKTTWSALVAPLRDALKPPANVSRLSSEQAVRKVARQHLKQHPIEIGGQNRGPWVRLYCEGNDGPDWAWCAGFASLILLQAHFYLDRKPPLKGSVSCDTLAAQAKTAGRFVGESEITRGSFAWSDFGGACIFLKRRTPTDWVHTGFSLDATGPARETVFTTIEGNTNDEGSREGYEACERRRSVVGSHYDFIALG